MQKICSSVKYVGVDDHKIDLFEGQFSVPNGMAYNSYVISAEKIAVMDSVDANFGEEWLNNIRNAVHEKTPDYLVVQHMEMDHSANIKNFMDTFPQAKIVSSKMAFVMMKNMFARSAVLPFPNSFACFPIEYGFGPVLFSYTSAADSGLGLLIPSHD